MSQTDRPMALTNILRVVLVQHPKFDPCGVFAAFDFSQQGDNFSWVENPNPIKNCHFEMGQQRPYSQLLDVIKLVILTELFLILSYFFVA